MPIIAIVLAASPWLNKRTALRDPEKRARITQGLLRRSRGGIGRAGSFEDAPLAHLDFRQTVVAQVPPERAQGAGVTLLIAIRDSPLRTCIQHDRVCSTPPAPTPGGVRQIPDRHALVRGAFTFFLSANGKPIGLLRIDSLASGELGLSQPDFSGYSIRGDRNRMFFGARTNHSVKPKYFAYSVLPATRCLVSQCAGISLLCAG